MSLKTKIILTFSVLMAALALIMSRVGYYSVREIYLEQLSDQASRLARLAGGELNPKYLSFLESGGRDSLAVAYYSETLKTRAKNILLADAFIFNRDFEVLARSASGSAAPGSDPRLRLNRSEIQGLQAGESAASLPFKGGDGEWYLWGFYRLDDAHWLGIQESAARLAKVEALSQTFWGIGIAGVLVTILCGWLLARAIARPVERLVQFSQLLGKGNFSAPLPQGIRGELAILANALDKMRAGLAQHHREKELLLAQIAHEIRNPLGGIELLAGLVKEDLQRHPGQPGTEYVEKIQQEIGGLKALITAYLNFSRPAPAQPEWIAVQEMAEEVRSFCCAGLREKKLSLSYTGEDAQIHFDRQHLRQILINLVSNSIEALGQGGSIAISAWQKGSRTLIAVSDDGPGIPPEHRENIFEPFFTTRSNGSGLGLAICKKLCRENGAEICLGEGLPSGEDKTGKGTVFIIKKLVNQEGLP